MTGFLQYLHAADPTDTPIDGEIPVASGGKYVPTNVGTVTNIVTAAGTLTANQIVVGSGSKAVAALGSLGTTTTVLHGNAAGAPTFATVVEADITLADNTTNNVSTTKHGFTPKLPNDATKYLDGTGAYTVPGGGSGPVTTTGSPANGNLTKFSGASSITNADLTGDVTTSGTVATTLANSGVTAGDYGQAIVTLDAKGRATAATQNYLQYRDEKSQGTDAGTFTSGAWRTRTLNTEVSDVGGFGALSSNQITLSAGTYRIYASAPADSVNAHQLRLQNATDATTIMVGPLSRAVSGAGTTALLQGVFTVAASKALELQHQCVTTKATNGFGTAGNFTTEVYAVVELWKIG